MSDDQPADPKGPIKDTLDYVPRAEVVSEETVYGQAVDEVVGGGRRSGGGMAPWLIGGGVGCLLVVVMCAGVIGVGVYKFQQVVGDLLTMDADQIRERTTVLADIDIPDTFQPALASQQPESLNTPDSSDTYRMVIYTRHDGRGVLALGYVPADLGSPGDLVDTANSFLSYLDENDVSQGQIEQIDITDEETREMTIRGEDAQFTFSRGTVQPSGDEFRQVVGHFEGKRQRTWLILQVETEAYDEAEIDAIIASIQ